MQEVGPEGRSTAVIVLGTFEVGFQVTVADEHGRGLEDERGKDMTCLVIRLSRVEANRLI